ETDAAPPSHIMDWDADNPRLAQNLVGVLSSVRDEARLRRPLSSESARDWQIRMMQELAVPDPFYVGRFRGEPGIEHCEVEIARRRGVEACRVRDALATFDVRLRRAIALLDGLIPLSKGPTADQLSAVIDLCAWAHAEWVRIHPFANGNGRT